MATNPAAAFAAETNSPFLDIPSFTAAPVVAEAEVAEATVPVPSPFRAVYRSEELEESADPESEEVFEFLFELHEREFEDSIVEVAGEIRDLVASQETGGSTLAAAHGRLLDHYLDPLTSEAERLVDHLADAAEARGFAFSDEEIDGVVDGYAAEAQLSPAFEHFFGGLKKKLKKLAKRGAKLAKKGLKAAATLGLGPVLRKLKKHLGKLLRKVLQRAIGKLPAYLQPVARKLYKRYAGKFLKETEIGGGDDEAEDAISDAGQLQLQIDQYLTYFIYADEDYEQDAILAEMEMEADARLADPMADLHQARARFVEEISSLGSDEDPAPAIERFVPAILPLLKAGVKIAGRKRIVNTLSKHLAKLIRKFVGKRYARPLSRAVVDLGLRYAGLEVSEDDGASVGAEAVAYTVEDTVRRLAALPEQSLQDAETLEANTIATFEAAAAAYLPDVLPGQVYDSRPDLRESCDRPGFWAGMPLGSRAKLYRKMTGGVSEIGVCPHTLARVRTWRGQTLASHLRNRLGVDIGRRLNARVQLYEVMPGGGLQDIARSDPDLQIAGRAPAWMLLHPLTREAAGMLLHEPGLGRAVPARYLDHPARSPAVGQRFFFLQIADAMPQVFAAAHRAPFLRRPSEVTLCLNLVRNRLVADIFLSEARAQEIAAGLRSGITPAAAAATTLRALVAEGIGAALARGMHHRVRIVHPAMPPEQSDGRALRLLPAAALDQFTRALCAWIERVLAGWIGANAAAFLAATEANDDGVTLRITFPNPPGIRRIRTALSGAPVRLRDPWFSGRHPDATIEPIAGAA